MPRYYNRGYRRSYSYGGGKKKYSSETAALAIPQSWTVGSPVTVKKVIIPSVSNQGVRKLKNFDFQISSFCPTANANASLFWAIVYVPEGTQPSNLTLNGTTSDGVIVPTSMYEPNQNVIMRGIVPVDSSNQYHFRSRLARNLNSGDSVYLLLYAVFDGTVTGSYQLNIGCTLNYAIAY